MKFRSVIPIGILMAMFSCNSMQAQNHTVTASWPAKAGVTLPTGLSVTGYKLYRSTTAGGEGGVPLAIITDPAVNSFVDSTVVAGNTYFYKYTYTAACDAGTFDCAGFVGESPMSSEATPGKIPLPKAPSLSQPTGLATAVN